MGRSLPTDHYGIQNQDSGSCELDVQFSELLRLGYTVVDSGFSDEEVQKIRSDSVEVLSQYKKDRLKRVDAASGERSIVRAPLFYGLGSFRKVAASEKVLALIGKAIRGLFILNQQNLLINSSRYEYGQAAWHRDLPYQHWVASRPISINCIFCVDPFTEGNGPTAVIPCSHMFEDFPSDRYIERHAKVLTAAAGSFLVMNSMLYHCGTKNNSVDDRLAINNVYTIPGFARQISFSGLMAKLSDLSAKERVLFSDKYETASSVNEFIDQRK